MLRNITRHFSFVFVTLLLAISVNAQGKVKGLKETVILISIDGMRADYLDKFQPPTLTKLAADGVRAKWMKPSFPTKTFPNHYTIATGLYPDHHGLIENNMWDKDTGKSFSLGNRAAIEDAMWWGGEPIWNTAMKNGMVAGAFFFPGTETVIGGMRPKYFKQYDGKVTHEERVDTVLSWFDLPAKERPRIITMYFSDVDDAGHGFGPDSDENRAALLKVDGSIKRLIDGLAARGATKKTNIIVVSDHGMAPYTRRNAVVLDEIFDPNDVAKVIWVDEFTQIFPKPGMEAKVYDAIKAKLPPTVHIYRPQEFPARYHFGSSKHIAPITVIPDTGSLVTNKERYQRAANDGTLDKVRGGHGYDNDDPLMRATFIASGPKFKRGYVAEPFENVDVYDLMCKILKIKPAKNDGVFSRIKPVLK